MGVVSAMDKPVFVSLLLAFGSLASADTPPRWVWTKAHKVPDETTSEQSGYFSIVEGRDGGIYIGTAKYGDNAFLVRFDPAHGGMDIVVDAEKEIGVDRKGFAAQAKIHTRNNVGKSGRIYFGTKQGYRKEGEKSGDYPGGHPMVYDPAEGKVRVYGVPVPHQGIISVTPDEGRGVAYVSTCSDERPIESAHFLVLDLESGQYRDLLDTEHVYAFIVVDHRGRAYHPVRGGEIARYDPETQKIVRLRQTVDGAPPEPESHLADPDGHPINWEISPDRKTLYAVAMGANQLVAYDLDAGGDVLPGRRLGKLVPGAVSTDCRAMCVGADGTVWAGVAAKVPGEGEFLRLVSYEPGAGAPIDRGALAIRNTDYAEFEGKEWHHGVHRPVDDILVPRYVIMGICAAGDGRVYLTTLYPFTLHEVRLPEK
jgi:sugar lactone lactonase YvrE